MLSYLLTHLNPSSRKNILLAISDLTRLEMGVGESSIDFMSCVRGASQRLRGVSMDQIISLFAITSLDHERYPSVKSRYLAGDPYLVNCDLLGLSGLLSSKEIRQQAWEIPPPTSPFTANYFSDAPARPPPTGRTQTCPIPSATDSYTIEYPPQREVLWKCITTMIWHAKSCPGYNFNKLDSPPQLKFHQGVGCTTLAKHGCVYKKDVTETATIVDTLNKKFPKEPTQPRLNQGTGARRATEGVEIEYASAIWDIKLQ